MVPSRPSTPVGGAQSISPSLLRTNSGILAGGQAGSVPSQPPFPSLVSPRTQFNNSSNNNNMSLLGNISNVSSLLNHSFSNGVLGSGAGIANSQQRNGGGAIDFVRSAQPDPLSFASSSGQAQGQHFTSVSGENQFGSEHSQPEAAQNFQQQFSVAHSQQQQLRGGGLGNVASVKLEPQSQMGISDQNGPSQHLQSLRGMSSVKLEPQQLQALRGLGPVKMEAQHSDQALFLQQQQQQQQQQQLLHLSRQSSQAAAQMSLLQQQHQQRILQMQQQQQQQQILNALPQQRTQLQQQQQQQQLQQQALSLRSQVKPAVYEPGTCARRLTQYMYHQQHRPADNNIEFWRKFVAEFFASNARKRWCVSLYGNGRQTTGVFPQDVWYCEICNCKPGRGFETTVEVLPRLCKIKYDSGTVEELLYVDMPREYHNASGQIVLDYAKAIQESVFDQLRVVRDGKLRLVFSSDLKICSWEFCARRHEELIPRRLIIPQVSQLGAVAQKYQAANQNASSNLSTQELQSACNSFVTSARQLAKALEVPLVNDLGYTKRYVRCLQISEVVNSMKDLIDYSRETGTGPMASLINFPRRTSVSGLHAQPSQQPEEQQSMVQNSNQNEQSSAQVTAVQLASTSNGIGSVNNSLNATSSTTPATAIVGLLHQNSMNSRQENHLGCVSSPYGGGNSVQIPSASSSSSLPQSQLNPSSPFSSQVPSASNNNTPQTSLNATHMNSTNSPANISAMQHPTTQSTEADPIESQSSVQQIIQEMMMSSQLNGVHSIGNEMKGGVNGVIPAHNGGNCLVGNGIANNPGINSLGFVGSMGGIGQSTTATGIRAAIANNAVTLNGRVGMGLMAQDQTALNHQSQQDLGNRLLSNGLGTVNSFSNLQFDWKTSP